MATANLLQTSVSGGTQNALSLQGDGVFFPKASTASRLALTLTTTDKGFIVYDTTDNNIYFWNGAAWESVPGSGDAGANGSVQYNDNGTVSGASNFIYNNATGLVSLASATITGAATVGTTLGVTGALTGQSTASFLVGTSLPLHIRNSGTSLTQIGDNGTIGAGTAFVVGSSDATLRFQAGGAEAGRINTTGVYVLKGGTTSANGVGVAFPATQVASSDANTLDDYEEGVWVPSVTGEVNLTSTTLVSARYTKIGRVVTVSGSVTTFIITSNTLAYFVLQNLPFTAATVVAGPLWNDSRNTSGSSLVSTSLLYGFQPAASGTTTGSVMIIAFSNTYTV